MATPPPAPAPRPATGGDISTNEFGQPVGATVDIELPVAEPPTDTMVGRWCSVSRLDVETHAADLFAAYDDAPDDAAWTYLAHERASTPEDFVDWCTTLQDRRDWLAFAISDADGPCGTASYLRITPEQGSVEVGGIHFAPRLQGTTAATEAMFLMMQRAFDAGYRRYEWKCDSLNAPSRAAALRLGFTYEGDFRQAVVYKGRNRDTSWFSIVDSEWPALRGEFERWLDPANFDDEGRQRTPLRHTRG